MTPSSLNAIILAAGKGTRMRSALPKVLHPIAHKPMVAHVIETVTSLGADAIQLVYGHGGDLLKERLADYSVNWVEQKEQLGTGHAVQQVIPHIQDNDNVLILFGDGPLIQQETLEDLLNAKGSAELALLTVTLEDPSGYGRIIRDNDGHITGIVEHKDATDAQRLIKEINTGIMAANGKVLKRWLNALTNDNAQGEYYLTDVVAMAASEGVTIASSQPEQASDVEGVNDRVQLAALERAYQRRQAKQLMLAGATLMDPARIDVRGTVEIENDVVVDVNVIFEGNVYLAEGAVIEANCVLRDCRIGKNARVKANSVIEGAVLGENAQAGPFARLRPGTELSKNAAVGNFVEIKNTFLGEGAKSGHLTYLGDATIGTGANIGAGTITCNYDGVNKFKTEVGDAAFIGSNSSLVAPVRIGHGATTGAGSVITQDIDDNDLGIGRSRQRNISGWKRPSKKD